MARLIPQSELHGQRDQILDSYQAMEEFRQAMNRPDDLPGFDDLLKAMGLHRSNYRQGANKRKLIDAVHNGEWAVVKPRKVADSGGASWSAFNPKPEPPPAQHLVEEHAYTLPQPAESGFHIVQKPMTLEALERELYEIRPGDSLLREFRSLNRHLGERVKPGQMVLFSDSRNYMCRREEAQMMAAAEKVNEALKDLSDEEASFMVEHHEVIEPFLEVSAGSLGIASYMIGQHLDGLKKALQDMEQLHQQHYRQYGHLRSPDFFAQRKRILTKLDGGLGALVRKGTGIADHPKLKRALGLSTRRTIHRWDKAGGPTQLPGYASNIVGVARAAKFMQIGGYVGIGLATGAATLRINEVCRTGTDQECQKVKFIEGSKLAGNVGTTLAATTYTAPLTMEYCAGVALKTRGIGGVICVLVISGATASVAGNTGSKIGDVVGEIVYEATSNE
ncbi:hypothetical protein V9L13_08610 [Pseudomonas sp. RSB 5.4]|uniref:hypothetical protein n=1 Tax=Pseudomonas sp. RSB 5.4 TaxID=3127459 RepID=UPI0030D5C39E